MDFNVKIIVPEKKLYLLTVPENNEFKIMNYGFAGTWLMETHSDGLNSWKTPLDPGKWEVLGYINDIFIGDKPVTTHNFALRYK